MLEALAVALACFLAIRTWTDSMPAPIPQVLRIVWFTVASYLGWALLRDKPWLLTWTGDLPDAAALVEPTYDPEFIFFYELQLAYHSQSLIFSLIKGAKPEMYLHHVVTVLLVVISFYFMQLRIGSLIMLLHDVPDIAGYMIKASVEIQHKLLMKLSFIALVITWGYFRLFLFTRVAFSMHVLADAIGWKAMALTNGMAFVLVALHFYWYVLFFVMAFTFKRKGVTQDISEVKSLGRPTHEHAD